MTILQNQNILSFKCKNVQSLAIPALFPYALPDSTLLSAKSNWSVKSQPDYTKLRGGYYTPAPIAKFLVEWAIRSKDDTVLEPSLGDGVFVEAATLRLKGLGAKPAQVDNQIYGFEIDKTEFRKAVQRAKGFGISGANLHSQDFFRGAIEKLANATFDVVLGNPPFIRYQHFEEEQRTAAFKIMQNAGLHPNRLTNAWVPFLVTSSILLGPQGHLGMVIPAELLQVTYAAELRLFLSEHFRRIKVITFRRLTFNAVQQEVVLLLAERGEGVQDGIEVVELDEIGDLSSCDSGRFGENGFKSVDHTTEKWTQYYLSNREIELVRSLRGSPKLTVLGDLGDADVGVVTGLNDFFVMTDEEAKSQKVVKATKRLVSRSAHLLGTAFTKKDWSENARRGYPVRLLDLPPIRKERLPLAIRNYLRAGEESGLDGGYKCRIRKFWYVIPSTYSPDSFLLRQIHHFPKLVTNESKATSTDTIHRVRFRPGIDPRRVAAAFLNSLTFAFAELLGRSYGGGVLELEPSEANRIPIPLLQSEALDFWEVDALVRQGKLGDLLRLTDQALLHDGMGLSKPDIQSLGEIWRKLRERRKGRRSSPKNEAKGITQPSYMGRHPLIPIEVGLLNPCGERLDAD